MRKKERAAANPPLLAATDERACSSRRQCALRTPWGATDRALSACGGDVGEARCVYDVCAAATVGRGVWPARAMWRGAAMAPHDSHETFTLDGGWYGA
jgi:hypothetical protein